MVFHPVCTNWFCPAWHPNIVVSWTCHHQPVWGLERNNAWFAMSGAHTVKKIKAGSFPKQDYGIFQKDWIYFQQALTGSFHWIKGLCLPPPSPVNLCSQLAAFLHTVHGSRNKTWPFGFFSPSIDHCSEFSIPALSCYDLFLKQEAGHSSSSFSSFLLLFFIFTYLLRREK